MIEYLNIDVFNEFINYTNKFEYFIKIFKNSHLDKGFKFSVTQNTENIVFKLNAIKFTDQAGIVDYKINKAFKHFWINFNHGFNNLLIQKKSFNSADIGMFSNFIFGSFLTSAYKTKYFNTQIFDLNYAQNEFSCNKKLLGILGNQYCTALTTITDTYLYNIYIESLKGSSLPAFYKNFNEEFCKSIQQRLEFLKDSDIKNLTNIDLNLNDLVAFYKTIVSSLNENLDVFEKTWFEKFNFFKENNNMVFYYNPQIIYDDCLNINVIYVDALYTDSSILKNYDINKFKDINKLIEDIELKNNINKYTEEFFYDFEKKKTISTYIKKKYMH